MSDEFAWLTEHSSELCQRYSGKWIAVLDGEVIGVGDTATAAAQQAEQNKPDADFILESIDAEPERV